MANQLLFLLVLFGVIFCGQSEFIVYNTSQSIVPGKLNVHLVAHTHDDVGWLKTVDQYYGACVQNVLDSLVSALLADKNRKFIYVEQAFFLRWWKDQSEAIKHVVKKFVSSGQLEFINGAMCMHDEAATHYIDMIDQTTMGHQFLKKEFGVTPRIGWQIDPFGHSAVQAYLLGAEVGFDSLFFGRIDYQDRAKRKIEKSLEVIWQGSKSLGSSAQIFAGAFPENYDPPAGFHFEVNDDSPIIQDNVNLFDYNVQDRVNDFVAAAVSQANITRTNHIMWTMGTDFKYQYANTWFRQMDKLIHYVNKDGRVNALYSTPSIYTDAKYAANESWPIKTDDFFPYADRVNAYWTGYFTSRPAVKYYVRVMSGYYLAARQLEYFRGRMDSGPNTDSLADALAIAQHHDGVSGTEKQHVANDYSKRLSIGYKEAEQLVASSLACLVESTSLEDCQNPVSKFQQCPLMNISYCPASEVDLVQGKNLVIVVYNSLGWSRNEVVRIPVNNEGVTVHDFEGKEIESQLLPQAEVYADLRNYYVQAYLGETPTKTPKYWLAFTVSVPPLGFSTYTVSAAKKTGPIVSSVYTYQNSEKTKFEVGQGNLKLRFSPNQEKFINYVNTRNLVEEQIEQSYIYYTGYNGTDDKEPQNSGAYVFRPNGTFPLKNERQVPLTVIRGPLLDEVHQQINPWIYQITRLHKEKEHVEVEFIVGPIPIEDGIGKEVVTKISTSMETNKMFYTDSNGRDFIKRIRDYRADWDLVVNQPIAGNYYPINLGIYMKDNKTEFSVLVDRSVGGSSLADGQIELMVHRRLLLDDSRGVAEALNETDCVLDDCRGLRIQGKTYFRIDPLGEGAKWRRTVGQEIYSPLLLAFSEQDEDIWINSHVLTYSGIDSNYSLPHNIAIITLQELENGKVLLRLAHLYEMRAKLTKPFESISTNLTFSYATLLPPTKELVLPGKATISHYRIFKVLFSVIQGAKGLSTEVWMDASALKIEEDKDLSVMATVELKKLFPRKEIKEVKEMNLSANQERAEMEKKRLVWKVEGSNGDDHVLRGGPIDPNELSAELAPMEIRTFIIYFDHASDQKVFVA
ncbi:putative alpha-mannosidase [Senna tora]|uniref:Alpha-mannosidase n=1 Tax=Senna tora TaxID=362788 RepID=A0A834TE65_9FABA|nr:putative alpha-mannosidase [Senna tora]